MVSEKPRKHMNFSNEQQKKEFLKFQHDAGYSSFSEMARKCIIKCRNEFYSKTSDEKEKMRDWLSCMQDTLVKKIDYLNERTEHIAMIINQEGLNPKVGHAMKDILKLLIKLEMDHSEILSKCKKHDDKTLDTALSLLLDAELILTKKGKK